MQTTREFIQSGLPSFLATSQGPVHGLFVSYNEVSGYDNGPVNTDKAGLSITVQNGYYCPDLMSVISMSAVISGIIPYEAGHVIEECERGKARNALSDIESSSFEKSRGVKVFACVYAGVSAFFEALDYAKDLKKKSPEATIVILTCDCGIDEKSQVLDQCVRDCEITDYVVTSMCGGYLDMARVLEALINLYPITERA